MADATSAQPSRGRWYVLLLISVMYLITYLDRVNISTAAPQISKEFGFDKVTMGFIFSAFVWAYALFQVPGGWLSDRFGARGVLTGVVAYWSIMTAATAAAFSGASFIVIRFLFGIGEAGAFPGATRAMQLWYPRRERGLVQGVTHSASRLGAAIAPPIVVLIMSEFGWRPVFYICGGAGLLWSLWWSGRIEARTGLRMMPTFPRSPLSFRTAGFPQYGWKAGISGETFPARHSA